MKPADQENPWLVEHLEEFLYFCCPECHVKDQSKESFLEHALNQHPKAKLGQFNFKKEPSENYSKKFPKFQGKKYCYDTQTPDLLFFKIGQFKYMVKI